MSKNSRPLAALLVAVLSSGVLTAVSPAAHAEQTIGFPTFSGPALPAEPVGYTPGNMMRAIYDREASGTDFWMDRLLARQGPAPAASPSSPTSGCRRRATGAASTSTPG